MPKMKTYKVEYEPVRLPLDLSKEEYDVIMKDHDDAGREIFVVVETRNRQKEIDSFRDSCDMDFIVKRFLGGDLDIVNQAHGFFVDCRDYPENPQQCIEIARAAESAFLRLTAEEQAKYNGVIDFIVKSAQARAVAAAAKDQLESEVKDNAES